jgi:drug/metabolite transporter (DMT)-like permease
MIRRSLLYGLFFIAIVTVSFAAILIRLAEEAPVLTIATWRLGIATLLLTPFSLRRRTIRETGRCDALLCVASGVFLAFHFICWISSLRYTSVASSVVLVSITPIFVGLGSFAFLRERVPLSLWLAIALCVCGGVLIEWGDIQIGRQAVHGDLLALGGALMGSAYFLIGRRVRQRLSLSRYIFLSYGTAALVLLGASLITHQPLTGFRGETYLYLLLVAIGPQLIGHTTFNWALKYLPASTVAVLILGEPIGSTFLAYLFFKEGLTLLKGGGAAIILTGIYLSLRKEEPRNA